MRHWILLMILWLGTIATAQEAVTVPLKPVDVVSLNEAIKNGYLRGQSGTHQDMPFKDVKAYPALKATKPWYGKIQFGGNFFSGMAPEETFYYVLDKTKAIDTGYNRLILDLNQDLDLTNDEPLLALENQSNDLLLSYSSIAWQACFPPIELPLTFETVTQTISLTPRVYVSQSDYVSFSLICPKTMQGKITIGKQNYEVTLGHKYAIAGWFNAPYTGMELIPQGSQESPSWWEADRLMAMHLIDGTYYRFSATPSGDQFTATPYTGELGEFKIGPGKRDLDSNAMLISGSLLAQDKAVAVGGSLESSRPTQAQTCRIPVGDYLANYLSIKYGSLSINISTNYHSDGSPRDRFLPRVFGFQIRKDKPCVLDFSNTPEIMFASPGKDTLLAPGDELMVKAVLIDPKHDFMIRGLRQDGQSLDPTVRILGANGKQLAEGKLPFG